VNRVLPLVAGAWLSLASGHALAFVFSDGASAECKVGDLAVLEVDAAPDSKLVQRGHVAMTEPAGSGYRIQWNAKKLASLPGAVHDLLFFHECAHAQLPTTNELRANCVGLQMMRVAGRAGFAVESRLAAYYGADNDFWVKTLACANAEAVPARPPG
jgi:hypothetical protein